MRLDFEHLLKPETLDSKATNAAIAVEEGAEGQAGEELDGVGTAGYCTTRHQIHVSHSRIEYNGSL